ncbi:MAG: hypothetical protein Q9182_002731 [Xanthomendoza sp. 2 TL-2023]
MASADDRSQDRSSVADERGNPFVTFSRLVDQQISSLFRNILDFPSSLAVSKRGSDMSSSSYAVAEQQRRWRDEANALEEFLNGFGGQHLGEKSDAEVHRSPDTRKVREFPPLLPLRDQQQQASGEEREAARRPIDSIRDAWSREGASNESQERPLRCPYDPQPSCPYRPASEDVPERSNAPSPWSIIPFFLAPPLVDYLDGSPYSPLRLEDRHPFCEHGAKWRRAFADLLAVQQGVDNPCEHEATSKEDWMLALPMYLASQEARPEKPATRQPENDAEEDGAPNESDLYKYFLGGAQVPRTMSSTSTRTSSNSTEDDVVSDHPCVVSTMTTTQRTTRPDGSVYSQVVLKKRFSDGREESTETEHTTNGRPRSELEGRIPQRRKDEAFKSTPSLGYDGKVKQAVAQKIEEKKKSGWFWS